MTDQINEDNNIPAMSKVKRIDEVVLNPAITVHAKISTLAQPSTGKPTGSGLKFVKACAIRRPYSSSNVVISRAVSGSAL